MSSLCVWGIYLNANNQMIKIISKFWDTVKDREAWQAAVTGLKSQTWVTEQQQPNGTSHTCKVICMTEYLKLHSKSWEMSISKN